MRPVPIEDDQVPEGSVRKAVMSPRDIDDPHFMSLEALITWITSSDEEGFDEDDHPPFPRISVQMKMDDEEIDRLVANGGYFWYTTLGHPMRPFNMEVPE